MPVETFSISFESTQNKQQYGATITCTEIGGEVGRRKFWGEESYGELKNVLQLLEGLTYSH